MNERVRELAEQVYGSAHYDDFKFAQLIIRECCEWIESSPSLLTKSFIVDNLKGRYGVEE